MGVKIASSRGQICIILHNSHHEQCQNPPKVATKSSRCPHHGELLAEELGFAKEKSEFEPLMHPKSDTHCPYPITATSSMQMGAYPSTHTHPGFSSGNTRHPPTHDKKWSGRQPCFATFFFKSSSCHHPFRALTHFGHAFVSKTNDDGLFTAAMLQGGHRWGRHHRCLRGIDSPSSSRIAQPRH